MIEGAYHLPKRFNHTPEGLYEAADGVYNLPGGVYRDFRRGIWDKRRVFLAYV